VSDVPLLGYRTTLEPGTPTFGPNAATILGLLGHTPMPWQREFLDVAGAVVLDDDGRPSRMLYPYVVLDVPRRAGKTAGTLSTMLHRLTTGPRRRVAYTAQKRADASQTFREEWTPLLATSPLSRRFRIRSSNGSEGIRFPATESTLSLFAPTATAVHGQDNDLAAVDEAWAFTTEQGDAIEAGIQPAQATRPLRQMMIVSAGGTHASTWLRRWVDLGEAGTPGVALIRYAAGPDDDPEDPTLVERVHPALGHTITLDTLLGIRATMPRNEYDRAFLGLWTTPTSAPAAIPAAAWRACTDPDAAPAGGLAYGLGVSIDGTRAAIAVAGAYGGRLAVEIIDAGPGTSWVPGRWREIRERNRGRLYADALSPAAPTIDRLKDARLPVDPLTTGAYVTACAALVDDVVEGRIRHRGQPALDEAIGDARSRNVGDRFVWDRRAGTDSELVDAVTCALAGARRPASTPTVAVHTSR
jgi:hypothetical protein